MRFTVEDRYLLLPT